MKTFWNSSEISKQFQLCDNEDLIIFLKTPDNALR